MGCSECLVFLVALALDLIRQSSFMPKVIKDSLRIDSYLLEHFLFLPMDYLLYFILKVNYSLVVATFSDSNSFETIFIKVVPTFYSVDSKDNVLLDWCPLLG